MDEACECGENDKESQEIATLGQIGIMKKKKKRRGRKRKKKNKRGKQKSERKKRYKMGIRRKMRRGGRGLGKKCLEPELEKLISLQDCYISHYFVRMSLFKTKIFFNPNDQIVRSTGMSRDLASNPSARLFGRANVI